MGKFRHYTKEQVLDRTREVLHFFANKQMKEFAAYLDEGFVWIGDYEALYTKGIKAFMDTVSYEIEQAPVNITKEEYAMLAHERQLWVTYGRFMMTGNGADGRILITKVHFTFTWIQRENDLKLILANATHVKSAVPMASKKEPQKQSPQSLIFEQASQYGVADKEPKKMAFRDVEGAIRYLYPEEILYIRAENKLCEVHTGSGTFSTRLNISSICHPQLLQIHRSYIVNRRYVKEVRRYQAALFDGTVLPVGRDKYQDVRLTLAE